MPLPARYGEPAVVVKNCSTPTRSFAWYCFMTKLRIVYAAFDSYLPIAIRMVSMQVSFQPHTRQFALWLIVVGANSWPIIWWGRGGWGILKKKERAQKDVVKGREWYWRCWCPLYLGWRMLPAVAVGRGLDFEHVDESNPKYVKCIPGQIKCTISYRPPVSKGIDLYSVPKREGGKRGDAKTGQSAVYAARWLLKKENNCPYGERHKSIAYQNICCSHVPVITLCTDMCHKNSRSIYLKKCNRLVVWCRWWQQLKSSVGGEK